MNKLITFKKEHAIGHLVLANPPKNEMTKAFFDQLADIVKSIRNEKMLKGLIIESEGRHFSSGVNVIELLKEFQSAKKQEPKQITKNLKTFLTLSNLPIPVVACITGVCMGSAFELALCAHFRLAAPNALISLPETGFGITPGLAGIYNTTKLIGTAKAMEFILTGNSLNASEALNYKLIDKIIDKKELKRTAQNFIENNYQNYKKELKLRYINTL